MKGDISCVADNSDIYTKPGIICPVVKYAPIQATIPNIANLPLSCSATLFDSLSDIRICLG